MRSPLEIINPKKAAAGLGLAAVLGAGVGYELSQTSGPGDNKIKVVGVETTQSPEPSVGQTNPPTPKATVKPEITPKPAETTPVAVVGPSGAIKETFPPEPSPSTPVAVVGPSGAIKQTFPPAH